MENGGTAGTPKSAQDKFPVRILVLRLRRGRTIVDAPDVDEKRVPGMVLVKFKLAALWFATHKSQVSHSCA